MTRLTVVHSVHVAVRTTKQERLWVIQKFHASIKNVCPKIINEQAGFTEYNMKISDNYI